MSEVEIKSLKEIVRRIRDSENGTPRNVLTISSTQGWVSQKDRWARNMAGDSLTKYTKIHKGDFSYNRGNSKTYPYGCMFRLNDFEDAVVPNVYHSFRISDDGVDSDFLQQFFWYGGLDAQLKGVLTSSVRDNGLLNITSDTFFSLEISLPPLPEQKKIAAILTSVDEVIDATQKQIDKLQDLKKATMNDLLTKGIGHTEFKDSELGRIPKSWEVKTLEEVSSFRRGSFPQPYGNPEWFDDNGHPFVQVYDIDTNRKLKTNTKTRISNLAAIKSVFIPKGSLLVTLQGSIGRVAVTQYDAYVDRTVLIFTKFDKYLDRLYFSLVVEKIFAKQKEVADGGIIKTITKETLKDFEICLPPIEEQQKIAEGIQTLELATANYQLKLTQTQSLKKSLMQDLLTGKVRVKVD